MVVVMMVVLVFVMIVVVIMMMAATGFIMVVVMVMMVVLMFVLGFFEQVLQSRIQSFGLIHCSQQLFSAQLFPVCCYDRSSGVQGTQTLYAIFQLGFCQTSGMAQNQAACMFNLIVEEFAEVLLIHLALLCIDNRREAFQMNFCIVQVLDSTDDIAQLANTRRFNQNPVWMILIQHLLQSIAEIANQTTANAAGVHFCDIHASILQETAVNSDFAKFIFN